MFRMLQGLDATLRPTTFFLCPDDRLAGRLVRQYEKCCNMRPVVLVTLPRPRRVGQSYVTSVFTALWTLVVCIQCLFRHELDAILCNGPGLCVCVALAAYLTAWVANRVRFGVELISLCRCR